ncbi:hypothetical protein EDD17DRAFT_1680247 [Pisolithus thermaeus]|nr:hypothetical protein EDD17DRAFT_1680247 [Pisolithus thermaeus]
MTQPEHPSTASSTDSIQSTASVSNATASALYTVLLLPWHDGGSRDFTRPPAMARVERSSAELWESTHWMSLRILVAAVFRNINGMLTDASLRCTRPLLGNEIQPTYPAQDLAAAVEVALAVHLERLRVTEALGRPRQCGGTSRGRIYLTWTEISYHISFGTRTRDSQAVVDPFINEPRVVQETRCRDSCTGTEEQTDDEKGINFERHVRNTHGNSLYLCVDGLQNPNTISD